MEKLNKLNQNMSIIKSVISTRFEVSCPQILKKVIFIE